jgi:tight adherence protein C
LLYVAMIAALVAVALATFSIFLLLSRYRQLTDPADVQRLKDLMSKRGHNNEFAPRRGAYPHLCMFLWRLTNVLSRPLVPFVTWGQRRRLTVLLDRAGLSEWGFSQVFLFRCLCTACAMVLGVWLLKSSLLSAEFFAYGALIALLIWAWWLPILFLKRRHRLRVKSMSRQLPFFLDMVGLGLDAGMNLQASIQLSLEHLGSGALHQEWSTMLADMRAGQPRVQALRQLSQRLNISSVRQLISSLIQGEAMGFSLGRIIQVYADQQRTQRLMHAEKLALQAPVKMLFPMAICIFPCTFIVLGFPVVVQLLGLGAGH